MTERERQLKRRIQFIVAGAMVVFFCLLITLTVQLSIRGNQRSMEAELRRTQERLQQQINDEGRYIDYLLSQKFIDEYALRELGYGRDGSEIFDGEK